MDSAHTIEIKVHVGDALHEMLIAELSDLDFESFVEEDDALLAYIRARDWNDVARETIERWLAFHGLPVRIQEQVLEPRNWNRQWEETIRPVIVGPFCIKPTWSDVPPDAAGCIVLEIDPKMSFGTGYHESTRLALRHMPGRVPTGAVVLDAGTGTGVLAIAAARLGAASVLAFDIDPWSQTNALENVYLNDVADIVKVVPGSLEVVPDGSYDLILANIHRSVLIDMLPRFAELLAPAGHAILAGLLLDDRSHLLQAAEASGLVSADQSSEGAWWSVVLKRKGS